MNRFFAFTQIDVFIKSNQQCFCSCDLDSYGNNSPVIRINDGTKLAPLLTFLSKLSVYLSPVTVNGHVQRSNDQHYTLISTSPLFYILAPTCFGSSLPSSGSFLGSSELLEIQIEWVVYHTCNMWLRGLCGGVSWNHDVDALSCYW
jgi:hypothetical protein